MATTTIQVSKKTRDHLAALAKERGLSLGQLVGELAEQQLTATQIADRVEATRRVLRERMGCTLTDEEFEQAPNVLTNVYAMAAEKMHAGRDKAA